MLKGFCNCDKGFASCDKWFCKLCGRVIASYDKGFCSYFVGILQVVIMRVCVQLMLEGFANCVECVLQVVMKSFVYKLFWVETAVVLKGGVCKLCWSVI